MKLLLAALIVIVPFNAPTVDFDALTLNQQKAFIQTIRPDPKPIVLPVQQIRRPHPIPPAEIEQLIRAYFQPEDVEWGLRVSWCESRWDANAKNPTSSASGLFQHLARYWDDRSARAGWAGADIFDPVANTAVAAWLLATGGKDHWVCK